MMRCSSHAVLPRWASWASRGRFLRRAAGVSNGASGASRRTFDVGGCAVRRDAESCRLIPVRRLLHRLYFHASRTSPECRWHLLASPTSQDVFILDLGTAKMRSRTRASEARFKLVITKCENGRADLCQAVEQSTEWKTWIHETDNNLDKAYSPRLQLNIDDVSFHAQ